jgi:hypothetical protein
LTVKRPMKNFRVIFGLDPKLKADSLITMEIDMFSCQIKLRNMKFQGFYSKDETNNKINYCTI